MSAIDPGIAEGIQETADEAQRDKPDRDHEEEEEDAVMQPSRWWFASTACPLIAGTFGPMASGFNICSLGFEWREYIPPGGTEAIGMQTGNTIADPAWELAINGLSLFFAIIANAALLLNMARRLRFSIAQPITITGFALASLLLCADVAAIGGDPHYFITRPEAIPDERHALTHAFYFACFASVIYMIIALLMCLTVYGANKGHYDKNFRLTPPQRTLMLQTMAFIAYMMIVALIYSYIEGWAYVNAFYWADITLLTIGFGDYSPSTDLGRGLLIPLAIGGILMVGLVVGSIRSLILERGKQKISARIVEKKRSKAVHHVDARRSTIKISYMAKAEFIHDSRLSPAQRREEEFKIMRQVQGVAERERRYVALATSTTFALILWLAGAAIFQKAEYLQDWAYLDALYFSYTSLLTIGYGDLVPRSNAGKAFFVLWSLLAVPSLTILISNMGDTVVKWFSDTTIKLGSISVLPEERGLRDQIRHAMEKLTSWTRDSIDNFTLPGVPGAPPRQPKRRLSSDEHHERLLDRLAGRLSRHLNKAQRANSQPQNVSLEQDIQFYHYVLARECRNLQKDTHSNPPKEYSWPEWEYYLKLMGNAAEDLEDFPGQQHANVQVPQQLQAPPEVQPPMNHNVDGASDSSPSQDDRQSSNTALLPSQKHTTTSGAERPQPSHLDGNIDRQTSLLQRQWNNQRRRPSDPETDHLRDWSWLSAESPLMSTKTEPEWILERMSAALERELNRQRKGFKRKPPIGLMDAYRRPRTGEKEGPAEKEQREVLSNAAESLMV